MPARPLLLWATASSPAYSDPRVTPSPSWAAAVSRAGCVPQGVEGVERGRGVAGASSPAFALGLVTADAGRRDRWHRGSSGLLPAHEVLPYSRSYHPPSCQAGWGWQRVEEPGSPPPPVLWVWREGTVWGSNPLSPPSHPVWQPLGLEPRGWQPASGAELPRAITKRQQAAALRKRQSQHPAGTTQAPLSFPCCPPLLQGRGGSCPLWKRPALGSRLLGPCWLPWVLQPLAPLCPAPPSCCIRSFFFKYYFYFNIFVI